MAAPIPVETPGPLIMDLDDPQQKLHVNLCDRGDEPSKEEPNTLLAIGSASLSERARIPAVTLVSMVLDPLAFKAIH